MYEKPVIQNKGLLKQFSGSPIRVDNFVMKLEIEDTPKLSDKEVMEYLNSIFPNP